MPTFLKLMGYLTVLAAFIGAAGCSPETNAKSTNNSPTTQEERPMQLPRPPLKIPMPLDKAGYKVDVTFEVPSSLLLKGATNLSHYFIGLRVLYAPGTDKVFDALEEHPVTVRISLHRIEAGKEVKIPLFDSKVVSGFGEYPKRYEVFEIPEGKATAESFYADHSGAPRGTPDASALVLIFPSPKNVITPGGYRIQVETLEDIPALNGVKAFFVYEEFPDG